MRIQTAIGYQVAEAPIAVVVTDYGTVGPAGIERTIWQAIAGSGRKADFVSWMSPNVEDWFKGDGVVRIVEPSSPGYDLLMVHEQKILARLQEGQGGFNPKLVIIDDHSWIPKSLLPFARQVVYNWPDSLSALAILQKSAPEIYASFKQDGDWDLLAQFETQLFLPHLREFAPGILRQILEETKTLKDLPRILAKFADQKLPPLPIRFMSTGILEGASNASKLIPDLIMPAILGKTEYPPIFALCGNGSGIGLAVDAVTTFVDHQLGGKEIKGLKIKQVLLLCLDFSLVPKGDWGKMLAGISGCQPVVVEVRGIKNWQDAHNIIARLRKARPWLAIFFTAEKRSNFALWRIPIVQL